MDSKITEQRKGRGEGCRIQDEAAVKKGQREAGKKT
jgi:hypothetical protein